MNIIGIILLTVIAALVVLLLIAHKNLKTTYETKVRQEFLAQPLGPDEPLIPADIAHLPTPVRKYIEYSGALGKPKVRNIRAEFDAEMRKAPAAAPMIATAEQYNFFGEPARLFYMKTSMKGIPARILHAYLRAQATMKVRVASIFDAVSIGGPELSLYETVTVLNDMCVLAPAALIDRRLTWTEIDSLSTSVVFVNGPHRVAAELHFNDVGELIDFHSDDRGALQDDKTFKVYRWWTPLKDYKQFDGRRVATYGETIWDYPEGKFTYGIFRLQKIEYNVGGYRRR